MRVVLASLFFVAGTLSGCSRHASGPEASAGDDHGHVHSAPHGGQLVELGEHAANLEVVVDAATGTLDIYVLDAHAEGYVRLPIAALPVELKWEGAADFIRVELTAVASPLTGETVGDTSRFSAAIPQLVGKSEVDLTIPSIEIGGVQYSGIAAHVHP